MKSCIKCGVVKEVNSENFPKSRSSVSGFVGECKECKRKYLQQYNKDNKDKIAKLKRQRYYENHEEELEKRRCHYQNNKEGYRVYGIEYRKNNPEVIKERDRRYYENNVEELAIKAKVYAKNNKAHLKEYKRKHRLDNLEAITEKERVYRLENPDVGRMASQRYRARMKRLPHTLDKKQWNVILNDFCKKCAYCGMTDKEHQFKWNEQLHQDHFVPLSSGGEYTHNNVIPSCRSCNSRKQSSCFFSWYQTYEFYDEVRNKFILEYLGYENNTQQLSIL